MDGRPDLPKCKGAMKLEEYELETDFSRQVLEGAKPGMKVRPQAVYDRDGDCIEFLVSNESFYAERIDTLVTVYRSQRTDEVIGSLSMGVSKMLRKFLRHAPGFEIEIRDGRVRLEHVFNAYLWSSPPPGRVVRLIYEKLREEAEANDIEVALGRLAKA